MKISLVVLAFKPCIFLHCSLNSVCMLLLSSQLICLFPIVILNEFRIVLECKYSVNDYYLNFRLREPFWYWILPKPSLICFPMDLPNHNLPCLNAAVKEIWLNSGEYLFVSIFLNCIKSFEKKVFVMVQRSKKQNKTKATEMRWSRVCH